MARVNFGMDEKTFWNLGLYDWTLWLQKIKFDRESEEIAWIRQSHLEALLANLNRDPKKRPQAYEMEDFYTPSWKVKEAKEDDRTKEEILSNFPKNLNGK